MEPSSSREQIMPGEGAGKPPTTNFLWSKDHDVIFCREVLVSEPYRHKLRSPERGRAWEQVAQHLNAIKELQFRVTPRSVRDRYTYLTKKRANELKHEEGASGIEVIQTELDILLEEVLEREREGKKQLELGVEDKKNKGKKEKISAEDMRKQAMERMSQIAKRKEEEENGDSCVVKKRKNRRGSNELFQYFEEKLSKEYALKEEELAMQMKEQEASDKRERERNERQDRAVQQQNELMVAMMKQQQQQQQQLQNLQTMFLNQQQQQMQALLALLEKNC